MNDEIKEEKNILSVNQMVGELLLNLVIFGVIFFIAYRIIYALIYKNFTNSEQFITLAVIIIGMQALMVFATFLFGNKKAFKKGTIYKDDVQKVMKNISFVIIIILLIFGLSMFASVESTIDEAVENDFGIKYRESLLKYIYDDNEMNTYYIEKEKAIEEAKNKVYQYLAVVETGICIVYISAIFLEKKYIYSKAI